MKSSILINKNLSGTDSLRSYHKYVQGRTGYKINDNSIG